MIHAIVFKGYTSYKIILFRETGDKGVSLWFLFTKRGAKGSDIDILVDLDYTKHIGLGFVQMQDDLEQKLQKKIDLVSSKAISQYLLPYIEKDKVLIYER